MTNANEISSHQIEIKVIEILVSNVPSKTRVLKLFGLRPHLTSFIKIHVSSTAASRGPHKFGLVAYLWAK